MHPPEFRVYDRRECVVFRKTTEPFGGLSNMAAGFPLFVNGLPIRTSEALYQACRFPHHPEIQRLIIDQRSPMTAKMTGKPYLRLTRSDWDEQRVAIMRWCLRVKLAQNWQRFGELLLATDDLRIVEESRRDQFWGAKPLADGTLTGLNVLGRLLRELRDRLRGSEAEHLRVVDPLPIPDFLLNGAEIGVVSDLSPGGRPASAVDETIAMTLIPEPVQPQQPELFPLPADSEAAPSKRRPRKRKVTP